MKIALEPTVQLSTKQLVYFQVSHYKHFFLFHGQLHCLVEVTLWQNNLHLTNQSIVDFDEIVLRGNDLFCLTNFDIELTGMGSWYFPDGSEVPFYGTGFIQSRGPSYVALTYISLRQMRSSPNGLYRCEIPDEDGQNVTLFAGVYANRQGRCNVKVVPIALQVLMSTGSPTITSFQFNFATCTITCISSGGPATTVTWTNSGGQVVSQLFASFQQQRLTDVTTATYSNLLTINISNIRDYGGHFRCRVENDRGSTSRGITRLSFNSKCYWH